MKEEKIISGDTLDEVWEQVAADMNSNEILLEYSILIAQKNKKVSLEIDIDPGGGFESGYETTTLSSPLENVSDFKFALHHQGLIDEVGKFFGMQDITIGYPEFDKKIVVKTNDEEKFRAAFSDEKVRNIFQDLTNFTFHITHRHIAENAEGSFLELNIEKGIVDPGDLREIYNAFFSVLIRIDSL